VTETIFEFSKLISIIHLFLNNKLTVDKKGN